MDSGRVEQWTRETELVVDDPQTRGGTPGRIGRECDPVAEELHRAGGERDASRATQLIAVDVRRTDVDGDLVVRVRGEKLGGCDDRAPVVRRVELDVERNGGVYRDRVFQVRGI